MSEPLEDGPDTGPDEPAAAGAGPGSSGVLAGVPAWFWYVLGGGALLTIYLVSIRWCGPWDPWETHYGEVARNIVARRDPLDLWWRPGYGPNGNAENTFYSKHAGPYWAMAASFWAFGIGANNNLPGEMANGAWTEVALRLPSLLAGLTTIGFLAYVAHRLVDWRAGVLVMLVLGTMPQFAIVTRQALTDMFFVGPVALAMGAWALAWMQDDRALRRVGHKLGRGRVSVPINDRAWIAFFVLLAIAVILPLAVLHHHVNAEYTIERVARFRKGKNIPNVQTLAAISRALIPYWIGVAMVLVHSLTWTRRSQAWMGFVYIAGGLSLMGKGFIGPGIIGLLILCDMLVSGRLHLLPRCGLGMGTLLFLLACLPWHHAMWLYRGEAWFNELIVVNNLARFASGEQDQAVGSFAFYVKTLGIAGLPWSALAPIVLWDAFARLRRPSPARSRDDEASEGEEATGLLDRALRILGYRGPLHRPRRPTEVELHRFALLWFVISFGLITYSVTKYYHYLLPVLPPLAVLTGLWMHGMLRGREGGATRVTGALGPALGLGLLGLAIAGLVLRQAVHEPAWIAHLTTYLYTGMWREGAPVPTRLVWMCVPLPLGFAFWLGRRMPHAVAAWCLSGLLVTAYVIDDYLPAASESWSQRTAFRHYFEHRKPQDKVLSWWFYYRGETFFSKHRIWVLMRPDRKKLFDFIDEHRGKDVTFWMMTTIQHANRVHTQLPRDVAKTAEVVYENHHYALVKAPIP